MDPVNTSMKNKMEKHKITCVKCGYSFDRTKEYKHCSNCFACTGCEIYYCPSCDNEIIIIPMKKFD